MNGAQIPAVSQFYRTLSLDVYDKRAISDNSFYTIKQGQDCQLEPILKFSQDLLK